MGGGGGVGGGVRVDVIEELNFLGKKIVGGGGGGWGLRRGQGGCDRRIEFFGKIPKKKLGSGGGDQVGGGNRVGGGVRVDVNKELKFL